VVKFTDAASFAALPLWLSTLGQDLCISFCIHSYKGRAWLFASTMWYKLIVSTLGGGGPRKRHFCPMALTPFSCSLSSPTHSSHNLSLLCFSTSPFLSWGISYSFSSYKYQNPGSGPPDPRAPETWEKEDSKIDSFETNCWWKFWYLKKQFPPLSRGVEISSMNYLS
jgi:hypothetical protein